jgi:hypothetical protein
MGKVRYVNIIKVVWSGATKKYFAIIKVPIFKVLLFKVTRDPFIKVSSVGSSLSELVVAI